MKQFQPEADPRSVAKAMKRRRPLAEVRALRGHLPARWRVEEVRGFYPVRLVPIFRRKCLGSAALRRVTRANPLGPTEYGYKKNGFRRLADSEPFFFSVIASQRRSNLIASL